VWRDGRWLATNETKSRPLIAVVCIAIRVAVRRPNEKETVSFSFAVCEGQTARAEERWFEPAGWRASWRAFWRAWRLIIVVCSGLLRSPPVGPRVPDSLPNSCRRPNGNHLCARRIGKCRSSGPVLLVRSWRGDALSPVRLERRRPAHNASGPAALGDARPSSSARRLLKRRSLCGVSSLFAMEDTLH